MLLSKLKISYYPEPNSHISDKVKVVLDLKNQVTKKELEQVAGIDTSDLAAEKYFAVSNVEVDKVDIDKLVNVQTRLNNLKTKIDDLDVGNLKTVSVHLKKLSDIVSLKLLQIQNWAR